MNEPRPQPDEGPYTQLSPEYLHDLRTPLNHILGYSDMLAEQAEVEGHGNYVEDLQKIRTAARKLLALLNNGAPMPPAEGLHQEIQPIAKPPAIETDQALILVVDDIKMNRDVLAQRLERMGHVVAFAENGRQAMDAAR
ncbi:MAG: hypothetical protein H7Y17_10250, partial [Chlorobia bacterium]|nr:hypothetical protein [Fimbriimonadaceae bacterium]